MKSLEPLPIRVVTHNIRYATTSPEQGEEKWSHRAPRLIAELCFNTHHCAESFICLQEVLHEQLLDILSGLNHGNRLWSYIGVGRSDGHEAGEYSPILFQPDIWSINTFETLWLSETPERPSKGWDAASIRILTVGTFQHRQSKKKVVAMNTHLDDQGHKSRYEACRLILGHIDRISEREGDYLGAPPAIFLAGDFNSEPSQAAYRLITSTQSPMSDIHSLVPPQGRYGDLNTFTGFGHEPLPPQRIDFLFINHPKPDPNPMYVFIHSHDSPWGVGGYSVLPNRFEDGIYCSDHRAVVGDLSVH